MAKLGRATIPPTPYGNPVPQSMLLPDTPEWRSVIRGLLLQGIAEYFWDADTGDVQGAVQVMVRALTSWVYSTMDGTIYRVNPTDACQIQSSTDDGNNWALFFDATNCGSDNHPTDYSIYFRQLETTPYLLEKTGSGTPQWETIFDARLIEGEAGFVKLSPSGTYNHVLRGAANFGLQVSDNDASNITLMANGYLLSSYIGGVGVGSGIDDAGTLHIRGVRQFTESPGAADLGAILIRDDTPDGPSETHIWVCVPTSNYNAYRQLAWSDELSRYALQLYSEPIEYIDNDEQELRITGQDTQTILALKVRRPVLVDTLIATALTLPGVTPVLSQTDSVLADGDTITPLTRTIGFNAPPLIDQLSVSIEIDQSISQPTATVTRVAIGDDPLWKSEAQVLIKSPDYRVKGERLEGTTSCKTYVMVDAPYQEEYALELVNGGRYIFPMIIPAAAQVTLMDLQGFVTLTDPAAFTSDSTLNTQLNKGLIITQVGQDVAGIGSGAHSPKDGEVTWCLIPVSEMDAHTASFDFQRNQGALTVFEPSYVAIEQKLYYPTQYLRGTLYGCLRIDRANIAATCSLEPAVSGVNVEHSTLYEWSVSVTGSANSNGTDYDYAFQTVDTCDTYMNLKNWSTFSATNPSNAWTADFYTHDLSVNLSALGWENFYTSSTEKGWAIRGNPINALAILKTVQSYFLELRAGNAWSLTAELSDTPF